VTEGAAGPPIGEPAEAESDRYKRADGAAQEGSFSGDSRAALPTISNTMRSGTEGRWSLEPIRGYAPFVNALLEYKAIAKLCSAFLNKMSSRQLHPAFDVLKTTGRTSSFGDINAQNLPRDDRVRSCFIPSAGHVFIDADYRTIEMTTLAQAVQTQFGLHSYMADEINKGTDLHRLVAARVAGKPEHEVTPEEREKAKPINFGKPGAMGHDGLKAYATRNDGRAKGEAQMARRCAWTVASRGNPPRPIPGNRLGGCAGGVGSPRCFVTRRLLRKLRAQQTFS
jgi:hypothetical protein